MAAIGCPFGTSSKGRLWRETRPPRSRDYNSFFHRANSDQQQQPSGPGWRAEFTPTAHFVRSVISYLEQQHFTNACHPCSDAGSGYDSYSLREWLIDAFGMLGELIPGGPRFRAPGSILDPQQRGSLIALSP